MVLFEELKTTIPSVERKFCTGAKYVDRFRDLRPAGNFGECSKIRMKHCLEHYKKPPTPEVVKRFDTWNNPDVEQTRIFHALVGDKQLEVARNMYHGIRSKDRTTAKDLIRPPEPTFLKELCRTVSEQLYESSNKRPLGRVPEPQLPESIHPESTVFGLPNIKDGGIAPILNPRKTPVELEREEAEDRKHYIISHKHLMPGEQGRRRYENFDRNKVYGKPTYCDERGIHARRVLNWFTNAENVKKTPVVSFRQLDRNERFGHKLGRPRDAIADTMKVPDAHVFGKPSTRGELTVGQLLHGKIPRQPIGVPRDNLSPEHQSSTQQEKCVSSAQRAEQLLPVIHHALREASFWRGTEITAVLCHRSNGNDLIPMVEAREIFDHFEVPLDEELTEQLFDVIMVKAPEEMWRRVSEAMHQTVERNLSAGRPRQDEDHFRWAVDWRLMSLFLDWKRHPVEQAKLKLCRCYKELSEKQNLSEDADAVRRRLRNAIDANLLTHKLSSEILSGNRGGLVEGECYRRLGKPPVELYRSVPKIRSAHNITDYGDEPTVQSVLEPSIYTAYGLSQRDLLTLRTKEEVKSIMDRANLTTKFDLDKNLDQLWNKAVELDKLMLQEVAPNTADRVTLYSFKEAAYLMRAEEINKQTDQHYAERCC
ncbi:EF-hand domain-containing member B [Clonorchis sinensis]|uniref:EF-hand domain-containing member B n=1 Tax=Clonorchis sinensis TaxID=79923 RepID=A0A8T1LV75_CLOSI|nr:EF-hand domain-containing member B [Clonorchis sinensis]